MNKHDPKSPSSTALILLERFTRILLRSLPFGGASQEIYDLIRDVRRSEADIDQQVNEAIQSLQKSTELVAQLERGVKERSENLNNLRAEYERFSKLAEIEADKAEALVNQLEITYGKGQVKERWIALGLNILVGLLFFLAGVFLSEPIKSWFL